METINFEPITITKDVRSKGGGIRISLDTLGHKGEAMVAHQNYLGGGMLGRVCVNDTIRANNSFVEESLAKELDEIAEQLKKYFHSLTNPDDTEWESLTYEQNQKLPSSAY